MRSHAMIGRMCLYKCHQQGISSFTLYYRAGQKGLIVGGGWWLQHILALMNWKVGKANTILAF